MRDYPAMTDHTEQAAPVPRRVRGLLGGRLVFDTVHAVYVWESPRYPHYYIPLVDVESDLLVDEGHQQRLARGTARVHGLRVGALTRPAAARVFGGDAAAFGIADTVRFEWEALDSWFEEEEQVFVHPRNPYTRVDALRSGRTVRVQLGGAVLAESSAIVMVFETGLPTRYYFNRSAVDFSFLTPSSTVTECPYKGRTSAYWSAQVGDAIVADVAWAYDFPTPQLLPITGLVAFLNEKVDIVVDGQPLERPLTPFS